MIVNLRFLGEDGRATIEMIAKSEAERAILAFLAEGASKRWSCAHSFTYRPGGLEKIELVQLAAQQVGNPATESSKVTFDGFYYSDREHAEHVDGVIYRVPAGVWFTAVRGLRKPDGHPGQQDSRLLYAPTKDELHEKLRQVHAQ